MYHPLNFLPKQYLDMIYNQTKSYFGKQDEKDSVRTLKTVSKKYESTSPFVILH